MVSYPTIDDKAMVTSWLFKCIYIYIYITTSEEMYTWFVVCCDEVLLKFAQMIILQGYFTATKQSYGQSLAQWVNARKT